MNNYNITAALIVLLTISVISTGFGNSAYASHDSVTVDCKDLAVALISWDGLYGYIDDDDITALEDDFGDDPNNDVDPSSFDDIVDDHMEDILDDFEDASCEKHISDDNEDWVEDEVDFER